MAVGMASTTWWGPHLAGTSAWQLPDDLWGTLLSSNRLLHLNVGGIYAPPTGLVALPGAAVILVPIVAVIDAAGLGLGAPGTGNPHPAAWIAAGPYEIALSVTALIAADAVGERLAVSRWKRAVLAASGGVALWNVSVRWGHPEDAVALALFLCGVLALADSNFGRSAWLVGVALAVQPLVVLALPVLLVVCDPSRVFGYLSRAAAPGAVLLGAALCANWSATSSAVANEPNWPSIDHPTPWTSLVPRMAHGAVAAGPARAVTLLIACGCALVFERRRLSAAFLPHATPVALADLLWWVALALALRCVFEPVMVAYYIWPSLAVALVAASRDWARLVPGALAASALTFASQVSLGGPWAWWSMAVAGLALALFFAHGRSPSYDHTEIRAVRSCAMERSSREPGHSVVQEHIAYESSCVDQAVGHYEADQATLALVKAPEYQPHRGVAEEAAETLIEVVRTSKHGTRQQRTVLAPTDLT